MVESDHRLVATRENLIWCATVNAYMSGIDNSYDEFESGERIHYALKCTDVSNSVERLFRETGFESDESDEEDDSDDENEVVINNIIIGETKKRGLHVTFSNVETCEPARKPDLRGRSTSHHAALTRTNSLRNIFNRVFRRSKSTTDGPSLINSEEPGPSIEEEKSKRKSKRKRFFKRTHRKSPETKISSIEVQEGQDVPPQEQNKFISRFFAKFKSKSGVESDKDQALEDRPSSFSLEGIRNSFLNLFKNRITV